MLERHPIIGPVTRAIMAMQESVERTVPLSSLFTDPGLRAVFRRAERDNGDAFAVPVPQSPPLAGGAAVSVFDLVTA